MYVLTTELSEVLNEFIDQFDLSVGRTSGGWNDPNVVKRLSGREYVALKSNVDVRSIYKILKNQTIATEFDKADQLLCGIEMQGEFHDRVHVFDGEPRWIHQNVHPRNGMSSYTRMMKAI